MGYSGSLLVVIKARGYKVKGLMILNFRVYNNYKFGIKELAVYIIIRVGWYYGYEYIRVKGLLLLLIKVVGEKC
jgi:hypothetical protein